MIKIKYGKVHGDCTADYIITMDRVTVKDFIAEWILDNPKEWGYFGIKNDEHPFFGDPTCEYRHGRIVTEPLPEDLLYKKIKNVSGSSGWSRSDFQFEIESEEE